ncbi:hypothetical protein, conserved [Leishmania tarentolae]|uniref:N-acetyltransferase ESCO acetyl-transferase domain-containing protein n=1 Tax=Leishmania tarentolae TaxID=5689 RepID=A0A640KK95_LEITA|nr:hypothetical protein, conserved [Leishmania tarentolae]
MPADERLANLDAEACALPLTCRSLADIRKHVFSPSYVVAEDPLRTIRAAGYARPPLAAATVVLYNFFAEVARRKRRRGREGPATCAGCGGSADSPPGRHQRRSTPKVKCCTATLRRAVLAALGAAYASIGSAGAVGHGGCVVIVHVRATREDVRCPSLRTPGRASVWLVDGVCLAEDIDQAYRAVWASPTISSEPLTHSNKVYTTAASADLCTGSSASGPLTVEGHPRAQVTRVGDSYRTGTSLCGVRLMWVSPASRGRGVAYSMIERARHAVCYGFEVPAEHVAFSEPTQMGATFARRYHARDDFLVYYY